MNEDNPIQDEEEIVKISNGPNNKNLLEINKRLQSGWILLGISYRRHPSLDDTFIDEEFYILGRVRAKTSCQGKPTKALVQTGT